MLLRKLLFFLFVVSIANAQKKQDILFTVDDKPVTTKEFLRVYNKNRDIVAEENQKPITEYLDLYINYKLKLEEAYALKLDTIKAYKTELAKYKEQLTKPYLKDANITKELIQEAYHRVKNEIKASHILVRSNPKASPPDTLKAYNKILSLREKIIAGEAFAEVAKASSEDPSAKKNGGDLGYFSAFTMVYPFENAAYTTKVGEVSMPFRTSFGYHIVKTEAIRPSKGEVEVAHIMIKNDTANANYAKEQIQDIYTKIKEGEPFGVMARKYSDDKASAMKGGRLDKFSANRMIEPFSSIAFALEKEHDISEPFETIYGWHIAQLIKKYPVGSYDELAPELVKKIERSERAYAAGKSVADKLKSEYTIRINENLKSAFVAGDIEEASKDADNFIFSINGEEIPLKSLLAYNKLKKDKSLTTTFNDFLDEQIIAYYKRNLATTNEEFTTTLQEYKDGLLLFDLLQLKIWKQSENDTIGLKQFYDTNKANYMHDERVDVVIARCTKKEKATLVKQYLEANKSIEEIKDLVNKNPTIHVLFSKGIIALGNKKLPKDFVAKKGVSTIYNEGKNQFVVVNVKEVLAPTLKEFKEAKGLVMNDYQEYLEKKWIKELRETHQVKINKRALKKITKEYK